MNEWIILFYRFVSGGCDSLVKVWKQGEDGHWTEDAKLEAHSDWVRYLLNYKKHFHGCIN